MRKNTYPILISGLFLLIFYSSCSKKIIPDKPFLSQTNFRFDSLPESEINIPVQIDLEPVYSIVENSIDTVFTSPAWPDAWVNIDCATRYKYHFRRGPLQLAASGQTLNIGFMGYYKIIGSTRVCAGNTVLSPWTPPCRCGFDEAERRVKVSFSNTIAVLPDYKIKINIKRQEPEPLDQCQVCFFGADITGQVMKGLKDELDFAKKTIEDSFGMVDLKPMVQKVWNNLAQTFNLYGLGWLQVNPQKIRLNNLFAKNDTLNVFLGLTAKPVIRFEKPMPSVSIVPRLSDFSHYPGFNIFLDAVLNYDSLSTILNSRIKDKQFNIEGSANKYVIIKDSRIYGAGNEKLIIKIWFTGTNEGIAYFTGKPVYNETKNEIEIRDIDFDVKTKNLLLKSADWLFSRRIINEISRYARFDLTSYVDTAKLLMNQHLNREWVKGIKSMGLMNEVKIIGFYPMSDYLIIRSNASGSLMLRVESINFSF